MISENIKKIDEKILQSCLKCSRNHSDIKLIAVSKMQSVETIREAFRAGIKEFGENKAQELRDKSELIKEDFNWHFIGHLQTNKVKYVIKSAEYIHAVDSIKLAEEINNRSLQLNKIQKLLLEIKTSEEATKFGLSNEDEIFSIAEFCKSKANIDFIGLMTMAPFTDDDRIIRQCFKKLRDLKEKLNRNNFALTELSMGMTNDLEIAIEEGATMLRIGTAIFGDRKNN